MRKRTIYVEIPYDVSEFCEKNISKRDDVAEIVAKDMVEYFGWDEGYCGLNVKVVDTADDGTEIVSELNSADINYDD